jgi:hypothetical protein
MDPNTATLIQVAAALVVIAGAVFAFIKWGRTFLKKIWHLFTRRRATTPRETIRAVPYKRENWWGMGSVKKQPAMQISGHLYATNITNELVRLLATRIIRPRKARVEGMIITRHPEDNVYGSYPILPKGTTEISLDYWVCPPILKEGENLKLTIGITDQFGNEHKVKNLVFVGHKKNKPDYSKPKGEVIYKIDDPIEKEVVAVLKAEVIRYSECGRGVGGLGSVQTKYGTNTWHGTGTEWRKVDSPDNQSVVPDPENALIKSDNATALINLYERLTNKDDKIKFVASLTSRLSRVTEYAPIGYFILLVLFRTGYISKVFDPARNNLYKDTAYGFSDLLRLLDGLLRFEHPKFTPEQLDEIEKFLDGVDEHPFRIHERIAAIRAYRLKA